MQLSDRLAAGKVRAAAGDWSSIEIYSPQAFSDPGLADEAGCKHTTTYGTTEYHVVFPRARFGGRERRYGAHKNRSGANEESLALCCDLNKPKSTMKVERGLTSDMIHRC